MSRRDRMLYSSVIKGDKESVLESIQQGADVHVRLHHRAPLLYHAVENPQIVRVLLAAGANANDKPANYLNLLSISITKRVFETVKLLLQWYCNRGTKLDENIGTLYFYRFTREDVEFERMLSLLVAAGVSIAIAPHLNPNSHQELSIIRARATSPRALESAAFELKRERMTDICIAMGNLMLPALLMTMIIEEDCVLPGSNLRMYHLWSVAAAVRKHKYAQY